MKPAQAVALVAALALIPILLAPEATLATLRAPVDAYIAAVARGHPMYWDAAPKPPVYTQRHAKGHFQSAFPSDRLESAVRGGFGGDSVVPLTRANFETFIGEWLANETASGNEYPSQTIAGTELVAGTTFDSFSAVIGDDADASTRFQIASISKTFTAVALMQVVENDDYDVKLDSKIEDFVPESAKPKGDEAVTIAQALTHVGGFEEFVVAQAAPSPDTMEPLLEYLSKAKPPQSYPAETVPAYSNYAYSLVGLVVETVTEMPFEDYLEENIFVPLGMADTLLVTPETGTDEVVDSLAKSGAWGRDINGNVGVVEADDIYFNYSPAGSVWSTANDMTKFMQMFLLKGLNPNDPGGARILTEESVDAMMTPHWGGPDVGTGYGLYSTWAGFIPAWQHDGDMPTFSSRMVLLPDLDFAFFISTAAGGAPARDNLLMDVTETFIGPWIVPSDLSDDPAEPLAVNSLANTRTVNDGCLKAIFSLQGGAQSFEADGNKMLFWLDRDSSVEYQSWMDGIFHFSDYETRRRAPTFTPGAVGEVSEEAGVGAGGLLELILGYPHLIPSEDRKYVTVLSSVNGMFPTPAGFGATAVISGLLLPTILFCLGSCCWCCSCCRQSMSVQEEFNTRMGARAPVDKASGLSYSNAGGFYQRSRASIVAWNDNQDAKSTHRNAICLAFAMFATGWIVPFALLAQAGTIVSTGPSGMSLFLLYVPFMAVIVGLLGCATQWQAVTGGYWHLERRVIFGVVLFSHWLFIRFFWTYDLFGNQCW